MVRYKLGVGINYWDDPKGLLEILETPNFYENVYVVYVIDGRYAGRDDKEEHTTELGHQICSSYPKTHYIRMYNTRQIDKRNKYWELAEKDDLDFLLVLDSDETVKFDPNRLDDSLEMCMKYDARLFPVMQDHVGITEMPRPRLFKKPFNYRHRQNKGPNISHGQLWSDYGKGDEEIIKGMYKFKDDPTTPKTVPGILMFHDKKWRTKRRVDADYLYYEKNPTR